MVKHYPQPQTSERLSSDFRPKSGRKFSCRFFILQGIAGEAQGELHGYCMLCLPIKKRSALATCQ